MLVHGKDQAQHDNRLNQVLNRLTESKITLNKVKCEFSVSKVKVLGHIVSSEGIAADPEKIEAIRNLAIPRNVAEVRRFLGMVSNVSKFADHLASKTKPLRELLKKKNTWVWGQPQDQAFTEIKEALTTAPILALYDPKRNKSKFRCIILRDRWCGNAAARQRRLETNFLCVTSIVTSGMPVLTS